MMPEEEERWGYAGAQVPLMTWAERLRVLSWMDIACGVTFALSCIALSFLYIKVLTTLLSKSE